MIIELTGDPEELTIDGEIVLTVHHGEYRTDLKPKDPEAFWELWADQKSMLKMNGIHTFMRSTNGKPAWHITLTRQKYNELMGRNTTNGTKEPV